MSLDDIFELEEPRLRRFWAMVGVVVPVGIFAGVAAWFIRAYVVPPVMTIAEPMTLAASSATPAAEPQPAPPVETTGAAPAAETPVLTAPPPVFATLAFVPMGAMMSPAPRPPDVDVKTLDLPDSTLENSEPIAGPVPLPHAKPRLSVATNGVMVPLPRPRPEL